jgi:hypothetical protein
VVVPWLVLDKGPRTLSHFLIHLDDDCSSTSEGCGIAIAGKHVRTTARTFDFGWGGKHESNIVRVVEFDAKQVISPYRHDLTAGGLQK